jgi:hypothetical protein
MSVTLGYSLPIPHRQSVRQIFLRRRTAYSVRQAAALLRLSLDEARAWVESGQLHVDTRRRRKRDDLRGRAFVTWKSLASAALLRWNVMQIHEALGAAANGVLPRLLRPVELKCLRLPEYQVRLLQLLAENEGVSLDEFVFMGLLHLETQGSPEDIEKLLPGYTEAIAFPDV